MREQLEAGKATRLELEAEIAELRAGGAAEWPSGAARSASAARNDGARGRYGEGSLALSPIKGARGAGGGADGGGAVQLADALLQQVYHHPCNVRRRLSGRGLAFAMGVWAPISEGSPLARRPGLRA
jgi:hypothetical protein